MQPTVHKFEQALNLIFAPRAWVDGFACIAPVELPDAPHVFIGLLELIHAGSVYFEVQIDIEMPTERSAFRH
jgi:hypothetical protein